MEIDEGIEKIDIEQEFEFITNYFDLNISSEEMVFVSQTLKNNEYLDFFQKNNPSFIIIKFLQKNQKVGEVTKNNTNLEKSFRQFIEQFNENENNNLPQVIDILVNNATKGLSEECLNSFSNSLDEDREYIEHSLLRDIYKDMGLLDEKLGARDNLSISEIQRVMIELEEKINIFIDGKEKYKDILNREDIKSFILQVSSVFIGMGVDQLDKITGTITGGALIILSFLHSITKRDDIQKSFKLDSADKFNSLIELIQNYTNRGNVVIETMKDVADRVRGLGEKIRI